MRVGPLTYADERAGCRRRPPPQKTTQKKTQKAPLRCSSRRCASSMRAASRDAKLADEIRQDPTANALFLDVLTTRGESRNNH